MHINTTINKLLTMS